MGNQTIYTAKIEDGELVLDDGSALLFPWWSVAKTVLAACALQLVGQSRLTLDDLRPGRSYTLRQLLQHTAGVSNYGAIASYHEAVESGDAPWTIDELLERVDVETLDFPPGQGWRYSNVGYLFVCQIIEDAAGVDIATAIQELAFDPLDIRSVTLAMEPDDLDGTAWGNPGRYHPGWVYHGLLTGTATDAVRFMDGLLSGRLLSPDLLEIMTKPHPLGGGIDGRPWETTGYGLGLMIGRMSAAGLAIGHSGAGPGSVNAVYHFPDCDPPCTVAAFTQAYDEGITEHAAARLATQ